MLFIALIVLNVATPRSDPAQSEQKARAFLTRAEKLLKDGDYENALWNFQEANVHHATPRAALGAAECYERLGDKAYAVYYYRAYLRRAPTAADGLEIAERVADLLLAEVQHGRALLEIESPVPAKGSVDGRNYIAFPIAAFVAPGDHELLVEFPTGPLKRVVSTKRGNVTTSVSLDPPPELTRAVASVSPGPSLARPSRNSDDGNAWIVIAHPQSYTRLTPEKLRDIFSGDRIVSLNGQIAQIVLAREGNPTRRAFVSGFLRRTEASFQTNWLRLVFRGGGARAPLEVVTDAEVVKAVASRPGAIGIVTAGTDTPGVTRVSIR